MDVVANLTATISQYKSTSDHHTEYYKLTQQLYIKYISVKLARKESDLKKEMYALLH